MKIDKFLQFFVVKEKKFYPLYIRQATNLKTAAQILVELLQEKDHEKWTALYKDIKGIEKEGDKITLNMYEELNRTFITPFDREDINRLGASMDILLDFIHDAARRVVMYRPEQINQTLVRIGRFIVEDAEVLTELMNELEFIQRMPQAVNEKCLRIKKIEQEVDALYEQFMSDLFAHEKDAIELIKLKNIAQVLEDATDKAKDVGDIVRSIIVKFA